MQALVEIPICGKMGSVPTGAKPKPGPLTAELSALLREHIARTKWSYTTIAQATDMPLSTFSAVVNGHKQIDIEQLDKICWAVSLDVVDLIKQAEETTRYRQAAKTWRVKRLPPPGGE